MWGGAPPPPPPPPRGGARPQASRTHHWAFWTTFFLLTTPLAADPMELVGLTLDELLTRFGTPAAVYAVRGEEPWQDDVVFSYDHGDFYVLKDRVWMVAVDAAFKLEIGDPRAAFFLVMGENADDRGAYAICPLPGGPWPLALRCDFDADGNVAALFIYRADLF